MSIRQVVPGERLTETCGHHCGIRSAAEEGSRLTFIGHCPCDECRCPEAVAEVSKVIIEQATIEVITDERIPDGHAVLHSGGDMQVMRLNPRPMCDG